MIFKEIGKNSTGDLVAIFESEKLLSFYENKQHLYDEVSLKIFIKNTNNKKDLEQCLLALSEFTRQKPVGCEKCTKSCVPCPKLSDFDKMLFSQNGEYKEDWEVIKKGVDNCWNCSSKSGCKGCPSSFIDKYNMDNSARYCLRFNEEGNSRKVLENMEKGMKKINSVMALTNGDYPDGV